MNGSYFATIRTTSARLLEEIRGVFLVRVFGIVGQYALQVLLARVLGSGGYGLFSFARSLALVLATLSLFGFQSSLLRLVPTYLSRKEAPNARGVITFSMVFVILLALLTTSLAGITLAGFDNAIAVEDRRILYAAFVLVIFQVLLLHQATVLRSIRKPLFAAAGEQIVVPGLFIAVIVSAELSGILDLSPWIAVCAYALVVAFAAAVLMRKSAFELRQFGDNDTDMSKKTEWLKISSPMFFSASFGIVLAQSDVLLLSVWAEPSDVGVYVAGKQVAALVALVMVVSNEVIAPQVASSYFSGKLGEVQKILAGAALRGVLFMLPVAFGLWVFRKQVLGFFGSEFVSAVGVLLVMLLGQALNVFSGPSSLLLNLCGRERAAQKILGGAAVMQTLLCVWLIPLYGTQGAAVSVAFSLVAWNAVMVVHARKTLGLDPSILAVVKQRMFV